MRGLALRVALFVALLASSSLAHGQRATERFIPLGESPGVSATRTTLGKIAAVDAQARRIRVAGASGPVEVRIEASTQIWIDRHARGLAPQDGTFADLREGRLAEVLLADPPERGIADWIKLEEGEPAP